MKLYLDEALKQAQGKSGDILLLKLTPHGRAHLDINLKYNGTINRYFTNLKDAFEWIIHAYNLKDIIHECYRSHRHVQHAVVIEDEVESKSELLTRYVEKIFLIITHMSHYDEKDVDEIVDIFMDMKDNRITEQVKRDIFNTLLSRVELFEQNASSLTLKKRVSVFRNSLYKKRWSI